MTQQEGPGGQHDTNATKSEDDLKGHGEFSREQLEAFGEDARAHAEKFGEAAVKFAQEAGYATAGFAGLVGEKAKSFYEEQKQQYAETHPDEEKDPGAKEFLEQLSDKLNRFVDDLAKGFKDMAERGRATVAKSDASTDPTAPTDVVAGAAAPADSVQEDVDGQAVPEDLLEEPVVGEAPTGVDDDEHGDL